MGKDDTWNLDQLLRTVRNRWWIILACTLITAGAAVGFSLAQRKLYTASASLLFRNPAFDQIVFGTSFVTPTQDPTREAATNVDLVSLPTVAALTSGAVHGELSPGQVRSEVTIAAAGQADVVNIGATDANPSRAARIANTYASQFILFRKQSDRAKIAGAQSQVQLELSQLTSAARNGSVGQSLLNRANQLRILASLQTGNAELVQPASVPGAPSSPNPKRDGILGGVLGLMLGFGLAFLLQRLDRRLREPSALEDAYGVPVLGAVPESRKYAVIPLKPLPALEAEAFALLRARLRYFNVDREIRSLLVTSAIPGEGKSTVALNLALAEAVAADSRVVLLEADLRRPSLARRLGVSSHPGLSELLSRNVTLEQALQQVQVPGRSDASGLEAHIDVITAGAIPPNPAELIESHAMNDLLAALSERFDHVIIDSPPTSVVSDAIPLVRRVSGVVVVSRIGKTTRDAARHLREQLTKLSAPTLGVIANAVSAKGRGRYGYTYGYAQAYEVSAADTGLAPGRAAPVDSSPPAETPPAPVPWTPADKPRPAETQPALESWPPPDGSRPAEAQPASVRAAAVEAQPAAVRWPPADEPHPAETQPAPVPWAPADEPRPAEAKPAPVPAEPADKIESEPRPAPRRRLRRPGVLVGLVLGILAVAGGVAAALILPAATKNSGNKTKLAAPAALPAATRHHRRHHVHGTTPTRVVSKPNTVKLQLVPTATVYVCLVNGSGRKLIPGRIFSSGQTIPTETARKLRLTLGNASVQMKVNGSVVNIAQTSPIGFLLQPSGNSALPLAQQPTCA